MNNLILHSLAALATILTSSMAWSFDRAEFVHSKVQSSLSSFLKPSSFLVIVNRADSLESGGDFAGSQGQLKRLPGLSLAVDERGDVVQHGAGAAAYFGPVIAKIIIDESVDQKTFEMIDSLLSEIVGGANPADELAVTRGVITQKPSDEEKGPQIQINNTMPEPAKAGGHENLRQLGLGLILFAALLWLLLRFAQPKSNERSSAEGRGNESDGGRGTAAGPGSALSALQAEAQKESRNLEDMDAVAPALYLMRALKEGHLRKIKNFLDFADGRLKRLTFQQLPAWTLSHLHRKLASFKPLEDEGDQKASPEIPAHELRAMVSEIALIEQSLKSPLQKYKALLQWFPAVGLRYVSQHNRDGVSPKTKAILWNLRSDLGLFATQDESVQPSETNAEDLQQSWQELLLLPSSEMDRDSDGLTAVDRWANTINQLEEFGPIETQLKSASEKLTSDDLKILMSKVCHLETPILFSKDERKNWLRQIEAEDYVWWQSLLGEDPPWKLENELRPLRMASFREAAEQQAHLNWSEDQKKQSAKRILMSMRQIRNPEGPAEESDAAVA